LMSSHSVCVCVVHINRVPVELLELVLMRTFIKLFKQQFPSHEAIAAAYSALSAVCYNWWQTMNGWPQSNTRHWLRHQLQHAVHCYYHTTHSIRNTLLVYLPTYSLSCILAYLLAYNCVTHCDMYLLPYLFARWTSHIHTCVPCLTTGKPTYIQNYI